MCRGQDAVEGSGAFCHLPVRLFVPRKAKGPNEGWWSKCVRPRVLQQEGLNLEAAPARTLGTQMQVRRQVQLADDRRGSPAAEETVASRAIRGARLINLLNQSFPSID